MRDGAKNVFLDGRGVPDFADRFPTIAAMLAEVGLDAGRDLLPVAPAAHYLCGGVVTDLAGRSAVRGLYAIGEVACSGAQGANRLASNSLLEGLVFASRAARAIVAGASDPQPEGALSGVLAPDSAAIPVRLIDAGDFAPVRTAGPQGPGGDVDEARGVLREAMSRDAGVIRDANGLAVLVPVLRRGGSRRGRRRGGRRRGAEESRRRRLVPRGRRARPRRARVACTRGRTLPSAMMRTSGCAWRSRRVMRHDHVRRRLPTDRRGTPGRRARSRRGHRAHRRPHRVARARRRRGPRFVCRRVSRA